MNHLHAVTALALAICMAPGLVHAQAAAPPAAAGMVKRVAGSANVERGSAVAAIAVGDTIHVGDTLRTGADGAIGLSLRDDTLLTVGANSEVVLNAFTFDSTTQDGSLLASVWRGTAAFVTGLIGKRAPEKVQVQTRSVVLGVRGTEFIVDAGRGAR